MTENCPNCRNSVEPTGIRCPNCFTKLPDLLHGQVAEYYEGSSISDNERPQYLKGDTFQQKVRQVYDRLENDARAGEIVTYGELMDDEGVHRARIAYVLGAISTIEDNDGHPPLSAIVVNSGTETPSTGFFGLSESLKNTPSELENWSEEEKHQWWESTVEEVHNFWSSH